MNFCSSMLSVLALCYPPGCVLGKKCQNPGVSEEGNPSGDRTGFYRGSCLSSHTHRCPFLHLQESLPCSWYPGLYVASIILRIDSSKTSCLFGQPKDPTQKCVGNIGVIHCLQLLSLERHMKIEETLKVPKIVFLPGFSKDPVVVFVCSCHFVLFRKFVGFASNALQHHAF